MTAILRRPRRKPGENRELLLEAGLIEFGLLGFHGASTAAIAARADVPQPNVYANFSTKQELFLACVERAASEVQARAGVGVPATMQRMVLQAVTAAHDPQLGVQLLDALDELRSEVSAERFDALLSAAGHSMLDRAT